MILFSLLILHGLTDSQGCVWRCHTSQLYTIEVTLLEKKVGLIISQLLVALVDIIMYTELRKESSSKNH